jgi:DNA-binding response OmpR family regulator
VKDDKSPAVRIAELEEENRQLRIELLEATRPATTFPFEWNLSPNESRLLAALVAAKGRPVVTDRLFSIIYGRNEHAVTMKNLHVLVWKLRRKLKPIGADVFSRRETGYVLSTRGQRIVQDALK